jgi:hypothetical protein
MPFKQENKAIIQSTHQTKTIPTAQNITTTYQKLYYKLITTDKLVKKLRQAQETGLIKKQIINAQDEPALGWKTQPSLPKSERKTQESHRRTRSLSLTYLNKPSLLEYARETIGEKKPNHFLSGYGGFIFLPISI